MIKVLPIVSGKQSRVLTVSSTKTLSPTVGRVSGGESWEGVPAEGRVEEEVEERGDWLGLGEASSVEEEGAEGGGGAGGAEYGFGVMCGRGTGLGVLGLGPE